MRSRGQADVLYDGHLILGEGPLWRASAGSVVVVDIEGRATHELNWTTGEVTKTGYPRRACAVFECADEALGIVLEDRILVAGSEIVPMLDPRVRFNDGKVDPDGTFWIGTMDREATAPIGSLYSLEDGRLRERSGGYAISNGLGWSPDGTRSYHVDTTRRRILVRGAGAAWTDGPLSVIDTSSLPGFPDGMSVDVEGRLWVAFWDFGAIRCLSADGRLIREIELPVSDVSSCAFAGPELDTLVVTSARRDRPGEELAGAVFALDPGTRGTPVGRQRLSV